MTMHHADSETQPIKAGVGLRQGCCAAPMIVRWALQDCTQELQESWLQRGFGLELQSRVLTHLAWADNTWLMDSTQLGLDTMWCELRDAAWKAAGLEIKWGKCSYANCSRDPTPAQSTCAQLQRIPEATDGTCVRVLGGAVQVGKEYSGEWDAVRRECWSAFTPDNGFGACTDTPVPKFKCCTWRYTPS